ncbi:MAG: NAD-dependent epimerase/dehydratase family protein [Treponema sp.]|nr:NAD-dependent epimerase/dehydratase family protein [Treponema sp.]
MKEVVLVTGATGFLGKYLITELSDSYKVIAIGRNEISGRALDSADCKFIKADFSDMEQLVPIFKNENISYVIHAGALSTVWGKWEDFYKSNVEGTRNIADCCAKYNVKKFVFISSPSVYTAKTDLFDIKENEYNKNNSLNYYIKSKLMAEDIVNAKHKEGLYTVILRPRGLIGIGDPSLIPRLMHANAKTGIPLLRKGKNLVDITCVENVAYASRLAMESENAGGETFNITNGEQNEFKTLLENFCIAAGEEPKFLNLPFALLYNVAAFLEFIYKLFRLKGEPIFTKYTICTLGFSQTLNISKAKTKLNYTPKISLADGIKKYGKWWNENKKN